jgi:carbon monoxide dehydrogenase subunit G
LTRAPRIEAIRNPVADTAFPTCRAEARVQESTKAVETEEARMAKFPTNVERSVTVKVPLGDAYAYMWNVLRSAPCIPGLDSCKDVGDDTYRFVYEKRTTGPVSMVVQYTARYEGNGTDEILFKGTGANNDNTDVDGRIRLKATTPESTRITLRQLFAPDTPVPRLLQGLIRSFVEEEAAETLKQYLANVKRDLEGKA